MGNYCSTCGGKITFFTKDISKTSVTGTVVTFHEVPYSNCNCDEYMNLLDGVRLDVYMMKNAHLSSHNIRFPDVDVSDEEINGFIDDRMREG